MDTATSQVSQLSPAFMGIYMIDGGVGLAILYLGNHVLHLGREGYPKELFPKEKRKQQFIWLTLALALAVTGGMMIVAGTLQGCLLYTSCHYSMWRMRSAKGHWCRQSSLF